MNIPTADAVYQWTPDSPYEHQPTSRQDRPMAGNHHLPFVKCYGYRFALDFTSGEVDVNQCPQCNQPMAVYGFHICNACFRQHLLDTED